MNRPILALSIAFVWSTSLTAQRPASTTRLEVVPPAAENCPVSLHAQQKGAVDMMQTGKTWFSGVLQQIRLTVRNEKHSFGVKGMQLRVNGTGSKSRYLPANMPQDGTYDATKTFHLNLKVASNEGASSDLLLPGFTSVQSLILESVTFSDGSAWKPASGKSCTIYPDPIVLVGAM